MGRFVVGFIVRSKDVRVKVRPVILAVLLEVGGTFFDGCRDGVDDGGGVRKKGGECVVENVVGRKVCSVIRKSLPWLRQNWRPVGEGAQEFGVVVGVWCSL